jgi:6-phosphogluconate dehydrogenase
MLRIGYIGLGKMGSNMVHRFLKKGFEVVAWNRSAEPLEEVHKAGAHKAESFQHLVSMLPTSRIIWLMLPAGDAIDDIINELAPHLAAGDLIIDGGNSRYQDTIRRAKMLAKNGVAFLDIGVSGGPSGAREGACLMIGGTKEALPTIHPLVEAAAAPQAYGYFGKLGSGHFAKMVHNGIEYGMMQAIGEGAAVLKASDFNFDLAEVFRVYNNQSVITSRLIDWTHQALAEDPSLLNTSSKVDASGEGHWTAETAEQLGVEIPVLRSSLTVRDQSAAVDPESVNGFRNKVVSAQRGKFGGHAVLANPVKK